jgi:hypothetical protein
VHVTLVTTDVSEAEYFHVEEAARWRAQRFRLL